MDLESLGASPVGQLVPISGYDGRRAEHYQYFAFLPDPLPEALIVGQEAWLAVTKASQALARLDQAGRQLANPGLLRAPLLRREAVSTSALEGTYAAFTDVLEAESDDDEPRSPEVREVLNYVHAAEYAFSSLRDGRLVSVSLLEDCQAMLVRGTPADGPQTGRIRDQQVMIGPRDCSVHDARFIPPPPDDRLTAGLHEWVEWLRRPRPLPALARAALAHYQFETLHPFHDGNGRIGRLAVVLQLLQDHELAEPLLEVSTWFEARRGHYQDHLLRASQTGDFDPWMMFFCEGIGAQAQAVVELINDLLDVQESIRQRVHTRGLKGVAVQIAEDLVGRPYLRVGQVSRLYNVTFQAANQAVGRLVHVGILEQLGQRTYDRVFVARDVVTVLTRGTG